MTHTLTSTCSCFPHIVNLACKAVLTAITNLKLAEVDDNTVDITAEVVEERGGLRDVIALGRSVVRAIRVSSLRRGRFADLQLARYPQDTPLELLRDVDTRWSSTLLMIERLLELKEFVTKMIADNPELRKYELDDAEWSLLQEYSDILKVPHAFQQVLSSEKTPTLHHALPCFQAMVAKWKAMANEKPLFADIINAGIEKLEEYMEVIAEVPAYTLAICT
ncbi:ribonuclease H-like domain-containing protein [Coprinopsis sp. MPI-PUGE-AT-0042]|nr:ribonuclease H-like domain-containing protein [Coprinopsis sp. MPI-PUGE-AT-0042]